MPSSHEEEEGEREAGHELAPLYCMEWRKKLHLTKFRLPENISGIFNYLLHTTGILVRRKIVTKCSMVIPWLY